jgi:hypothetical protein
VGFAAIITLCVASQPVKPKVSVYFIIYSVRKLLDTPSYIWDYTLISSYKTLNLCISVILPYVKYDALAFDLFCISKLFSKLFLKNIDKEYNFYIFH